MCNLKQNVQNCFQSCLPLDLLLSAELVAINTAATINMLAKIYEWKIQYVHKYV